MKKVLVFTMVLLGLNSLRAEYRVFQLQVVAEGGQIVREFPSTLDPLQYVGYYLVPRGHRVQYTETWLCTGDTSHGKPLCSNPNPSQQ